MIDKTRRGRDSQRSLKSIEIAGPMLEPVLYSFLIAQESAAPGASLQSWVATLGIPASILLGLAYGIYQAGRFFTTQVWPFVRGEVWAAAKSALEDHHDLVDSLKNSVQALESSVSTQTETSRQQGELLVLILRKVDPNASIVPPGFPSFRNPNPDHDHSVG